MKTFNYDISKNIRHELYSHIKVNLYDKEITIQKEGKIIVFNWNYSPQLTGKYKQRETYESQCIYNMVEKIINTISNRPSRV